MVDRLVTSCKVLIIMIMRDDTVKEDHQPRYQEEGGFYLKVSSQNSIIFRKCSKYSNYQFEFPDLIFGEPYLLPCKIPLTSWNHTRTSHPLPSSRPFSQLLFQGQHLQILQ